MDPSLLTSDVLAAASERAAGVRGRLALGTKGEKSRANGLLAIEEGSDALATKGVDM